MTRASARVEQEEEVASPPKCVVDRNLMNKHTVQDMTDIGLSIFAPLCGKNRGAFVLDPPDGNTYGCIAFPKQFAKLAGVESDAIVDSNSIILQYKAGNLTEANVVDLIDLYVQSVFTSSAGVEDDPFACDAGGLAALQCTTDRAAFLLDTDEPIRSATLAGLFVPALWATGGKKLTLREAKRFYTASDFEDMKALGLNAVQIPVPVEAFAADGDGLVKEALTHMLHLIETSELQAIIVLVDDEHNDNHEAVTAAAAYCFENSVLALTLPSTTPTLISAARAAAPDLPLLLPVQSSDLRNLSPSDDNVFGAVQMDHSTSVADVASSGSQDDRMKMFSHEANSCMARSPIEYAACYRDTPVFIASGFDLAIDNCVMEGSDNFVDYGQCGRFDETIDSGWWERHRQSLAARQLFAFELGVGWSFSAWKLYDDDSHTGVIDTPAKLLCLKNVAAAGLMPSLTKKNSFKLSCLNPPVPDFALGDATLSPTAGPPPDCGNGWWNFETKQCDYWVPPPVTPDPTSAPSAGCPECLECPVVVTAAAMDATAYTSYQTIGFAAATGAVVALSLSALFKKIRGDRGYSPLP
jgi:hypothetical protein